MSKKVWRSALAMVILLASTGVCSIVNAEGKINTETKISASADQSILNMYNAAVTYYDYPDDSEWVNGWKNQKAYGNTEDNGWSVFGNFNKALATYYKDNGLSTTGIYFGNLLKTDKAGKGEGLIRAGEVESQISAIKGIYPHYWDNANNSNYLTGMNYSAQGLVYNQLDANGNLQIANGIAAPWFDENFVLNQENGKVLSSRFPFREDTDSNGVSYYEFDSNQARDNVRYNFESQTFSYGQGTNYGVTDNVKIDWGLETDSENGGYGFFPFNYKNGNGNDDWLDFGFGAKMEIRFNLPKGGMVNGVPVTFEFTGDDDIWIFIDDKLVLDLGGAHKKAQGTIDFSKLTATVSTGTTVINPGADMNAVSLAEALNISSADEFSPNQAHKMTIFYMERGMIESNLKIRFNMQPLDHEFIAEKEVDVENVNQGIQEAVKNADEFNIELKAGESPASDKTYQLVEKSGEVTEKETDSGGNFSLKDSDQAVFKKQFDEDIGKQFSAVESTKESESKSYLSYDTNWVVTDLENQNLITDQGETTNASFLYQNSLNDEMVPVRLKLKYNNIPKIGNMSVTKTTVDKDGQAYEDTATDFTFQIQLDMGLTEEGYYQEVDTTEKTAIYFRKPTGWTDVYAYCYNNDTEHNAVWPGVEMLLVEGSSDTYKLENIRDKWNYVVFTDGMGTQYPEQGNNVSVPASTNAKNYYYVDNNTLVQGTFAEKKQEWVPGSKIGYKGYPLTYTVGAEVRTTDADGGFTLKSGETAIFNGIPIGTQFRIQEAASEDYTLTEVKVDGSSVISQDGYYNGVIESDTATVETEFVNQTKTASMTIQKLLVKEDGTKLEKTSWPNADMKFGFKLEVLGDDKQTYSSCANQEYTVQLASGEIETGVTDEEGIFYLTPQESDSTVKAEFPNLKVGNVYRVTEILDHVSEYEFHSLQIDGQEKTAIVSGRMYSTGDIQITEEGKSVVYKNYPLSTIEILKQDANDTPLQGAEFTLEKQSENNEWKVIGTKQASDADGKVFFKNLHAGTYRITEVKTPAGNVLLKEPIVVKLPYEYKAGDTVNGATVTKDGVSYKVTFTIINDKAFDLPASGRKGIRPFLAVGTALAVTTGTVLGVRTAANRRHRRRYSG